MFGDTRNLRTVPALALILAISVPWARAARPAAETAREMQRSAESLLADAAITHVGYSAEAREFLDAVDEFGYLAGRYATGEEGLASSPEAVARLRDVADRVTRAAIAARVNEAIARRWESTYHLIDELRSQPVATPKAEAAPPARERTVVSVGRNPTSEQRDAARQLQGAAEDLVVAVEHLPSLEGRERLTLLGHARNLVRAAEKVLETALKSPLPEDEVRRALARVEFYSERVEQQVAESERVGGIREAHEEFLASLDRMRYAIRPETQQTLQSQHPEVKPRKRRIQRP